MGGGGGGGEGTGGVRAGWLGGCGRCGYGESGAATRALLASDLSASQIDRFVCHPGGAKVVDAIEGALHLRSGSLDAERAVLRDAGNMSAPTVMFVMKSVLNAGATGQMMACALGPGFTASYLLFHVNTGAN